MNVLQPDKKAAIITLLTNGISQREIERKVRVDRKTIRKYARMVGSNKPIGEGNSKSPEVAIDSGEGVDQNPPPRPPVQEASVSASESSEDEYPMSAHARSACDPHRLWIEEQVRLGRNAVSIYQDLVERFAFEHKYNSVKRFCRGLRRKDPVQYDRLEFPPGEEAQVDYGLGALTRKPGTNTYRRPRLFVMTLKYSRRCFRKVVWTSSQVVWAKLHEEAFRYFGGATRYVVLDNLKEGVIKPDLYEPGLNPVYASVLAHYGVVADPARVADPDRKGSVENAIQHTQDTALKGRRFESIEEQNQWLMHWEERWASVRIHGRMKRQVQEMFEEEKPFLQALPLSSFSYFSQETRTVQDDGTIQVHDCYYAALPARLHTKVMVRIYDCEIEIIDPQTLTVLRRHPKGTRKGMVVIEEKDRIFNPSRQTCYLLAQAAAIGPITEKLCKQLFEGEGRQGHRRMQGIVALARKHCAAHIEQVARMALERGLSSSRIIRKLVEDLDKATTPEKSSDELTREHSLIRSPQDYALFFETHAAGNGRHPRILQ
ncbi:IS21 family transposase [Syntrophus buswellii]|uniref:IS21 family transposase n=1 Tax=Syntrophus buswellii TaxID=43774 RepID=UPI0038D3E2F1